MACASNARPEPATPPRRRRARTSAREARIGLSRRRRRARRRRARPVRGRLVRGVPVLRTARHVVRGVRDARETRGGSVARILRCMKESGVSLAEREARARSSGEGRARPTRRRDGGGKVHCAPRRRRVVAPSARRARRSASATRRSRGAKGEGEGGARGATRARKSGARRAKGGGEGGARRRDARRRRNNARRRGRRRRRGGGEGGGEGGRERRKAEEVTAARLAKAEERAASRWLLGHAPRGPDAGFGAGAGAAPPGPAAGPAAPRSRPPPPHPNSRAISSRFGDSSIDSATRSSPLLNFATTTTTTTAARPARAQTQEEERTRRRSGRARARGGGAANALGARGGVGIRRRGVRGGVGRAMLTPLLASHARGQPSTTLADAVALAPLVDAAATVPGNAWEETLRRYSRRGGGDGDAAQGGRSERRPTQRGRVQVDRHGGTDGARDGARRRPVDRTHTRRRGGDGRHARKRPRPYCALSARADAEAMAACEIERRRGRRIGSGEDDDVEQRRRRATELRAPRRDAEVAAVRQSVRVLAHSDAFRHPALGRKAAREAGNAASSVRITRRRRRARVCGGAREISSRRRLRDDRRAPPRVYAVAELTVGAEAMVSVDAAECGELVRAAGAPDRSASHAVPSKIERACRKGAPEGACAGDGHVVIDGGQYTLFGAETAKLPKVAWDDGCVVCGGDVNAGWCCSARDATRSITAGASRRRSPPSRRGMVLPRVRARARRRRRRGADAPDPRFAARRDGASRGGGGGGGRRIDARESEQARRGRELATRLTRRGGWSA